MTTLNILSTEVFVSHDDSPLTPLGRTRLTVRIVEDHWPVRRGAERFQVSPATASKRASRYPQG